MNRPAWIVVACCAAACAGRSRAVAPGGGDDLGRQDPAVSDTSLARDLEATVLEGYSQLSLGNFEAYGDTVAEDVEIAMLELGPDSLRIGERSTIDADSFQIEPCIDVLSKNLEVHLSRDNSVGWTFDEVSCRLRDPFEGRVASIPLRVTAVYQRHLDSWVLVMQHVSYALPMDDLLQWAAAGKLRAPRPLAQKIAPGDGIRKTISRSVLGILSDQQGFRERKISVDKGALLLWPDPLHEYHGAQVAAAPALEALFGPEAEVVPEGVYIGLARSKRLAWVIVNLKVDAVVNDDPTTIWLRGTYVFERRDDSPGVWLQVQAHLSVPVIQGALTKRVFGLELPDLSDLPLPGAR